MYILSQQSVMKAMLLTGMTHVGARRNRSLVKERGGVHRHGSTAYVLNTRSE